MRIVFIGPPGAGKGTQCKLLTEFLGIPHLSTGEMLRSARAESALGRLVGSYINAGRLAPDYLVMRIVKKRLQHDDCRDGCLFDGFPRTIVQAQLLDEHLAAGGDSLGMVISLVVAQEELIARMLRRAEIEHRLDDTAETIAARLRVFYTQTAPVLDYYADHGVLERIDAMRSPEEVFADIRQRVIVRQGLRASES
jgi:adenylate kinase